MNLTAKEFETGQRKLAGIGYMMAGIGFLTVMDSAAKALVGADYSVMQILAIRGWIIIAALMLILPRLGGIAALKTDQPVKHLLRVAVGFAAPYFFFSALKELGQADVTVIFFGGATFLMTGLAAPLFKEKVGLHRWGAVAVGFIGVLIAAQPTSGVFQTGALFAIGSGASYALLNLATRWMGPAEGAFKQVFFYNIGIAIVASFAMPLSFKAMPSGDIATITAMAILAIGGHFCMTRAFQTASVSLLAPFEYTAIIWAAGLGYLFWRDIPSSNVLLGAAIIVASGLYLLHRESLATKTQAVEEETIITADPLIVAQAPSIDKNPAEKN